MAKVLLSETLSQSSKQKAGTNQVDVETQSPGDFAEDAAQEGPDDGSDAVDGAEDAGERRPFIRLRAKGDDGLKEIASRFKDPMPRCLELDSDEGKKAIERLTPEVKGTLQFAAERITKFADGVMSAIKPVNIQFDQYSAGVDYKPIQRAACYVPGGRYPLPSTALSYDTRYDLLCVSLGGTGYLASTADELRISMASALEDVKNEGRVCVVNMLIKTADGGEELKFGWQTEKPKF